MAKTASRICVIGGANMDVGGFCLDRLRLEDSNIGRVHMSVGGVGRNIAENLARLGLEVELITAIGGDANGQAILADCAQKNIGTSLSLIEREMRSSVYLFVADGDGDMHCAVNDMEIQECITPEFLRDRMDAINAMDAAVIDANLPGATIEYLAENLRIPAFADAVSAAKVLRLKKALPRIYAFKPNRIEAELLTGVKIANEDDARQAAMAISAMGVKRVFLSMGAEGAVCVGDGQCHHLSGRRIDMVNASGAGDAFTAAMVWAHAQKMDLRQSCIAGMAAACVAVESVSAVNPQMNENELRKRMNQWMNQEVES